MAEGIRAYDTAGNLIFDLSTRMSKTLGIVDIGTGAATGSVTNADLQQGQPFWHLIGGTASGPVFVTPAVSVSGSVMSWDWGTLPRSACKLIYGIY